MALKKNMNLVELAAFWDFPVTKTVKNLPAVQETLVQSLGPEVTRKNERATHSSILAWGIPWTEESGGLQSMGLQKESDTTEQLNNNSIKSSCEVKFYFLTTGKTRL